jgi:hypothetical protein
MLAHGRPSRPGAVHPHPLTHAQGTIWKFPISTSSQPIHLPASLHFRFLSLLRLQCSAPLRLASACGARCGSVRRKDNMSASASSPLASEEKQEAAPVRHYKGVNDLDKVRELPGMFRLPDPDVNPRLLPWCCLKLDFSVAALAFSLSYIAYVRYKCLRRFRCMLQLFHLDVAKIDREMLHILHMLQVFQKHVASVCSRCFICFQTYVAIVFLSGCCICFTHMLRQYVPNILAVSILCCNKWFHVASRNFRCFMCFTHMLRVHIPNVSSIFRHMLHSNVFHIEVFYVVWPEASCRPRGERGGGQRRPAGVETGRSAHVEWGKGEWSQGEGGRGGLLGRPLTPVMTSGP